MKERFIIFDETNGKSAKGDTLKWISRKYGIPYVSNSEELLKLMKEDAEDNTNENHSHLAGSQLNEAKREVKQGGIQLKPDNASPDDTNDLGGKNGR